MRHAFKTTVTALSLILVPVALPPLSEAYAAETKIDALTLKESAFTLPESGTVVRFKHPASFHESVVTGGTITSVSYSDPNQRIAVTLQENRLDPETYAALQEGEIFFEGVVAPFSDKEHLLWGEYEILDKADTATLKSLTLKGFLKKPEDAFLPDQHNYFLQKALLTHGTSLRFTCQVQGRQAEVASTRELFELLTPLCTEIVNSLSVSRASGKE